MHYSEYLTDEIFWLMIVHRCTGVSLGNINPGNGTIWLDDVSCSGTETDIALCPHNYWGNHDCYHSEDVSVRCAISGMMCYLFVAVASAPHQHQKCKMYKMMHQFLFCSFKNQIKET